MVLVPAGEYDMGDHQGTGWGNELPVHAVYIDAFYMDTFEVTNKEYCIFLNSAYGQGSIEVIAGVVYRTGSPEPLCNTTTASPDNHMLWDGSVFSVKKGKEKHPVVEVSWYGAVFYANWRSDQQGLTPCYDMETWGCNYHAYGYRLPTEAEWEKACRGGEYEPYYGYPWGNSIDASMANSWNSGDPYEKGHYPWTTPVGYYDGNQKPPGADMANGYGLYDIVGNVFEWCNDWYSGTYYQYCVDHGIYYNPKGPSSSPVGKRSVRSGSWADQMEDLRCAVRGRAATDYRYLILGLRLVLPDS
jgi:formylglycine-generating enzyme required for sulfatase activity